MTQEFPIASRDHRPSIAQKRFDGMARGGCLPLIAIELADAHKNLRDFLLCCAGPVSVEGLQHAPEACPPLPGQAGIRRYGTAMQGGEKSAYGFDAIEAIEVKRDHRDSDPVAVGAVQDLEMLPVAERETEIFVGAVRGDVDSPDCR